MTKQELFDKMWAGFEAQNWEPAITDDGLGCMYLSEDGCKCAIGHLLPDGHPAQLLQAPVETLMKSYPELKRTVGWSNNWSFLSDAQVAHDLAATEHNPLKPAFEKLAENYSLTIPGAQ